MHHAQNDTRKTELLTRQVRKPLKTAAFGQLLICKVFQKMRLSGYFQPEIVYVFDIIPYFYMTHMSLDIANYFDTIDMQSYLRRNLCVKSSFTQIEAYFCF